VLEHVIEIRILHVRKCRQSRIRRGCDCRRKGECTAMSSKSSRRSQRDAPISNDFIDAPRAGSRGGRGGSSGPSSSSQARPSIQPLFRGWRGWDRVRRERKRQKRTAERVGNIRGMPAQLPPGMLIAASFVTT